MPCVVFFVEGRFEKCSTFCVVGFLVSQIVLPFSEPFYNNWNTNISYNLMYVICFSFFFLCLHTLQTCSCNVARIVGCVMAVSVLAVTSIVILLLEVKQPDSSSKLCKLFVILQLLSNQHSGRPPNNVLLCQRHRATGPVERGHSGTINLLYLFASR